MYHQIWNTPDICGTIYTTSDHDPLGALLQCIYQHDNFMRSEDHEKWEYMNIKALTHQTLRNYQNVIAINPLVLSDHDDYCSYITSKSDRAVTRWEHIFDLCLHDSAVECTYRAANNTGDIAQHYARLACDLWQYSRQLRQFTNGRS